LGWVSTGSTCEDFSNSINCSETVAISLIVKFTFSHLILDGFTKFIRIIFYRVLAVKTLYAYLAIYLDKKN
ncbi:MAG: hypothetical protein PVH56_11535, partial [Desulfobacterales bacterium]